MKIGLVLEGGAMRGMYTAGVLDVFMEQGINVDGIMGVSAGALFGVNYKSRQPGRTLRYNIKFAKDKRYIGLESLVRTGNIVNKEFCFDEIPNKLDIFDYDTFKKTNERFYAVVTNVETGEPEYIELDDLHDSMEYLRASGSMPFVSKMVKIDGKEYLDGGISDSIPVEKMIDMGYDKIIVVLTRPKNYTKKKNDERVAKIFYKKYPKLVEAINTRYLRYNNELKNIERLEKDNKIFVIRPSKLVNIKRIEKDEKKLKEMYELGRNDAKVSLDKLKEYLSNNKIS